MVKIIITCCTKMLQNIVMNCDNVHEYACYNDSVKKGKKKMVHKELVLLDKVFIDKNDFFIQMYQLLFKKGYVKSSYLDAIIQREKDFPTGLDIGKYAIAIPHCDSIHIKKPFIAFVKFHEPLEFIQMGTENQVQKVRMAFMLGFTKGNQEHVEMLSKIMNNFMNEDFTDKILKIDDVDKCYQLLTERLK